VLIAVRNARLYVPADLGDSITDSEGRNHVLLRTAMFSPQLTAFR
jgi:hypothetical protein